MTPNKFAHCIRLAIELTPNKCTLRSNIFLGRCVEEIGCDGTHCASSAQWGVRSLSGEHLPQSKWTEVPRSEAQDAKGGGRLREPNAARLLECPISANVDCRIGQRLERPRPGSRPDRKPHLASQTSVWGRGVTGDPPTATLPQAIVDTTPNPTSTQNTPFFSGLAPRKDPDGPPEASRTSSVRRALSSRNAALIAQ